MEFKNYKQCNTTCTNNGTNNTNTDTAITITHTDYTITNAVTHITNYDTIDIHAAATNIDNGGKYTNNNTTTVLGMFCKEEKKDWTHPCAGNSQIPPALQVTRKQKCCAGQAQAGNQARSTAGSGGG